MGGGSAGGCFGRMIKREIMRKVMRTLGMRRRRRRPRYGYGHGRYGGHGGHYGCPPPPPPHCCHGGGYGGGHGGGYGGPMGGFFREAPADAAGGKDTAAAGAPPPAGGDVGEAIVEPSSGCAVLVLRSLALLVRLGCRRGPARRRCCALCRRLGQEQARDLSAAHCLRLLTPGSCGPSARRAGRLPPGQSLVPSPRPRTRVGRRHFCRLPPLHCWGASCLGE